MTEDDQIRQSGVNSVPASARDTLLAHTDAGWPTPGVPDWLSGGYVTKERLVAALLVLADYLDRATGHPDAVPLEPEPNTAGPDA
jgi:hypothetical protein